MILLILFQIRCRPLTGLSYSLLRQRLRSYWLPVEMNLHLLRTYTVNTLCQCGFSTGRLVRVGLGQSRH